MATKIPVTTTAPIRRPTRDSTDGLARMECMEVWGGNHLTDTSLQVTGLDVWVYSQPYAHEHAGGDVFYISSCASGRITRSLVADVSGHGSEVSDVALRLRDLMRKYINFVSPTRFVRAMNRQFAGFSDDSGFATAVVATYFAPSRKLSLCNAGHPPPFWFNSRTGSWEELSSSDTKTTAANMPLGVVRQSEYEQIQLKLGVGDLVLCYTDSLTESRDANGRLLGVAGLLQAVRQVPVENPSQFVPALLAHLRSLNDENLTEDDVTAMLLRPNGNSATLRNNLLAPFRLIRRWILGG